jgi:tetratricopeptide (TPR) repeat protein
MHAPSRPPPRASSWPPPAVSFEAAIDDTESLIDAILASLARGRLSADAWDQLHAAARRDGRSEDVAAAFAKVSWGARMKAVQPSVAAEFLFQGARFFAEVLGDDLGAAMYLERSLALAPAHLDAFAKLEAILEGKRSFGKLADLYATAAPHRTRGQQAVMLRRAAEWLAALGEGSGQSPVDDRVIELWQQIARLEPGDEEARSRLESLYVKAGRFRDAVRLNEQSLSREPAPDEYRKQILLERIVELYADALDEPERAIAHVEQLLSLDPTQEGARRVGERLLSVKGLTGRAAAALATAYEADGAPEPIARYLSIELESARGPRRTQLLARVGKLREERLGDGPGALEAYDQALVLDPADEELRERYVELALRLGRHTDAVKLLERLIATARNEAPKARASVRLGETLLAQGDPKRAKTILSEVMASWRPPADAELRAARALRAIHETAYEWRPLCQVLDRLALLERDDDRRREINERLASVAIKAKDTVRAIEANERLLSTGARAAALEALGPLYRSSANWKKWARLLEMQAKETDDAAKARALLARAAEVRART